MTEVFGYHLPDQCRNCEFLNLNTALTSDSRDRLDPDTVVTAGDHLFTAKNMDRGFQCLLGMTAMLCAGTENPDKDELMPCRLNQPAASEKIE